MDRRYRPRYGGTERQGIPRAAIRRPRPRGDPGPDPDRWRGRSPRLPQRAHLFLADLGPAAADIETYLQSATLGGADRVRLFRLVWDTCISAFAGRQALYEYYFFGDPVRMAGALVNSYDRAPYRDRVQAFLDQDQPAAV